MSQQIKQMIMGDYSSRFEGVEDAVLVDLRGVNGIATNEIRIGLSKKEIRLTVIRNRLARRAFADTGLEGLSALLIGANTLVYGAESVVEVAREIVDLVKKFPNLELKGAILDGEVYEGEAGVSRLSKFPTREEAIAENISLIIGPGRKLVGQLQGPGSALAGIVKAIQEKIEAGEEIAKVG